MDPTEAADDQQLLQRYVAEQSEDAFRELVRRHVNLVYSAALRQVRAPQLAEEVAQSAFTDLAQRAGSLKADTMLAAWLHQVTRRTAIDVVRREARRQLREQIATEMNAVSAPNEANAASAWTEIEPLLDEAISALDEADRVAVLLRYFENKPLREVGRQLGVSDDAAQKRVSRAVERLREFFAKRGVTVGAGGLAIVISANAAQAAPVGLAVTISAAALAGTAATTSTLIAATTKTIAMTTLQKTLVTATVAVLAGAGLYQAKQAHDARAEVQALQHQQVPLTEQIQHLQNGFSDATNRLADLLAENSRLKANPHKLELLRLRGEVTRLRADSQELALLKAASLTKTNDPTEMALRDWVAQAQELHQRIDQIPEPQIPEFKFLTPNDWLDVAKDVSLETDQDVRNAAKILGANAKNRFAMLVRDALNKYVQTNNGELPTAMSQLEQYFPFPVGEDVLQGYAIIQSGQMGNLSEADRNFRIISENPFAPVGSGRPLVQIGAAGFIRTGQ